jgi:hypothetical protein
MIAGFSFAGAGQNTAICLRASEGLERAHQRDRHAEAIAQER